jgi:hypothetical protein
MAERWLIFCLSLVSLPFFGRPQETQPPIVPVGVGHEATVPWYESLPAVAMDYKVHIDPGKEDCYYQYVNPGATFYVSFQVGHQQVDAPYGLRGRTRGCCTR